MYKLFLFSITFCLSCFVFIGETNPQTQEYNTMIGVNGSTNIGGRVKQFVSEQVAVDLLVYRRWKGWVGALLCEHQMDIL
jgi:hypothetical protein